MSSEHCAAVCARGAARCRCSPSRLTFCTGLLPLHTQYMVQGARCHCLHCCRHIQSWCLGLCRHTQEHQFTTVEGIRTPFPFATRAPIKS